MITGLAWRLGCRLVAWAVKRDGATSVRIDARYGEPEIDWLGVARRDLARWN